MRKDDKAVSLPSIGPRQVVYEDKNRQIYRVAADFGTFSKEYLVSDSGHRAGLVVVQGEAVLLVRQYRLLIDRLSWEIPGGKVEENETPEAAAVRECLEETGLRCRDLKPLLSFHPGLDAWYNPSVLFYSDQFDEVGERASCPHEIEDKVWVPLSRCVEMIFDQEIVDSFSIVALLSYKTLIGGQPSPS